MTATPVNVVSREEWGALPSGIITETLPLPTQMVRFVLRTTSQACFTKEHCIKRVQEMQKTHQYDWKLPDINYNFLIGGDKNVYECRGWTKPISKMPTHASFRVLKFLTIGYIGDFSDIKVPANMQDTAYQFVRYYTYNGKIHPSVIGPPNRMQLSNNL